MYYYVHKIFIDAVYIINGMCVCVCVVCVCVCVWIIIRADACNET